MSKIPFVGYGNDSLEKLPPAKAGNKILCPKCKQEHVLEAADDGSELLLFYKCKGKVYLGAVGGRCVVLAKPDASGSVTL